MYLLILSFLRGEEKFIRMSFQNVARATLWTVNNPLFKNAPCLRMPLIFPLIYDVPGSPITHKGTRLLIYTKKSKTIKVKASNVRERNEFVRVCWQLSAKIKFRRGPSLLGNCLLICFARYIIQCAEIRCSMGISM